MKKLLIILVLLISSCQKYPDINEPGACEAYGVRETNMPLGEIVIMHELPTSKIIKICGPLKGGCVKQDKEHNTVDVYYQEGDICIENHEKCHAKHGRYHTVKYTQDIIAGIQRPACPS